MSRRRLSWEEALNPKPEDRVEGAADRYADLCWLSRMEILGTLNFIRNSNGVYGRLSSAQAPDCLLIQLWVLQESTTAKIERSAEGCKQGHS